MWQGTRCCRYGTCSGGNTIRPCLKRYPALRIPTRYERRLYRPRPDELRHSSEAFATVRKAALHPHSFLDIMNELFQSPVYKNYDALIADEKFEPAGFPLKLGLKDVRQVLEAAHDLASPMPVASVVRDHLISAMAHGQESLDWSSFSRVLARNAGLDDPTEQKVNSEIL